MSKHPYLERHEPYSRGHLLAILLSVVLLAVVLVVALADQTAEHVAPTPVTPATAGPAVEYQP